MLSTFLRFVGYTAWYIALLFLTYLMVLITLQYIPASTQAAFLQTKQQFTGMLHYRLAFFAHVYCSIFVLIAGIIQFPVYIRKRWPLVHKWAGRVYVFGIIAVSGPCGFIMGVYGNGGLIAQASFCILAILWVVFTFKALTAIWKGNLPAHQKWMYRSYALTLSAISLRLWKWLFVLWFAPKPMDLYRVVAWLGWVGNLLIAEWVIYLMLRQKNIAVKTAAKFNRVAV